MSSKNQKNISSKNQKSMKPMYKALLEYTTTNSENSESIISFLNSKEDEILSLMHSKLPRVKTRQVKDPNAPKKPLFAYILFCKSERLVLKKELPNLIFSKCAAELGKRWNNLPDYDKKVYKQLEDEDKKRYLHELQSYIPPTKQDLTEITKKRKKEGPKKPQTSYMMFGRSERLKLKENNPEITGKQILVVIGERWRSLSTDDKKEYEKESIKDKERYQTDLNLYNQNVIIQQDKEKVQEEKIQKKKEEKNYNIENTKVLTGFIVFCQEQRSHIKGKNPKLSNSKINEELKQTWENLSDDEKLTYEESSTL